MKNTKYILKNSFEEMKRIFIFYLLIAISHIGFNIITGQTGADLISLLVIFIFLPGIIIELHDSRLENRKPIISKMFAVKGKIIGAYAYSLLFVFVWTLVFIIPGIIKEYQYFRVPIIARDNPNWSNKEILTESKRQMEGKKSKLFFANVIIVLPLMVFIIGFTLALITRAQGIASQAVLHIDIVELLMKFFIQMNLLKFFALVVGLILPVLTVVYSLAVNNYAQAEITKENS